MTLKEQYEFLVDQAQQCADDHTRRRLLSCAATIWDFRCDALEEVISEIDMTDHTVVGPAKKKVAFRLDEHTVAMVDEEARVSDIKRAYNR